MSVSFGTSGLRGLVTELTEDVVSRYSRAFMVACPIGSGVYVGRDFRASSPHIADMVIAAARKAGVDVTDCGAVSTPALALAAMQAGAAAVMVTGSHIPVDRNGLKFYLPTGEIAKADETAITAALPLQPAPPAAEIGALVQVADVMAQFVARYTNFFGPQALLGLKLGVYQHSSVARDALLDMVRGMGAQAVALGRADAFIPVDTESVDASTRAKLAAWSADLGLDAILSTDGDGDRPLLTDAAGIVIAGDILGILTARSLGAQSQLNPSNPMARISIIYHHFPHYRAPVLRALAQSTRHEYRFFAGTDDFQGIKAFHGDDVVTIEPITFRYNESRGTTDIADFRQAISAPFDATIVLGNPKMIGAWLAVWRARRNGLKTAFWAHGWTRKESYIKSKIRNLFFSRADHVLSYGTRAIELAALTGFDPMHISVIWNSLDWDTQSTLFHQYSGVAQDALRTNIGMPHGVPIIGTISRVTELCHYEWLIDAIAGLRQNGTMAEVWMIGDGPVLKKLLAQAKEKGVPLHTLGAIYDEETLAQHIMAVDCIASPGKVGLTAMHALAFGTPVVSHSDFDRQMPEVEAIVEGKSGAFFEYGSVLGLQNALAQLLAFQGDLDARRSACRASLEGRFTPQDQVRLIDDAMDRLINGKT